MTDLNHSSEPSKVGLVFNDLCLDLVMRFVWLKAFFRVLLAEVDAGLVVKTVPVLLLVLAFQQGWLS